MSFLLAAQANAAGPPRQPDAAALARALDRLLTVGNVLYVAAHPDDENTRLLAWLANDRHLRAGYLSLTRGDGGQNLIGAEQGPLLGLIRTQELLAARRLDGAEQWFTRARDFGYSKTPDETLRIWGRDEILADVVQQIRRFKPDVIVTRFPPDGADTHGHHTASAMLALEAFKLAADEKYRPDQVARFGAWRAKRIVWNRSSWSIKPGEDLSAFLKMDVGAYDPLAGASFGELAADSRSMHKSQGFGVARSRGHEPEYFRVLAGEPAQRSILDGVDATWARVPGSAKLVALLQRARAEHKPAQPWATLPLLVEAEAELVKLPDNPWKEPKRREIEAAMAACAGLFVEATAAEPSTVPGASLPVTLTALNRSPAALKLRAIKLPGGVEVAVDRALTDGEAVEIARPLEVPRAARLSHPYWLSAPAPGLYPVEDPLLIGVPEEPRPLVATFLVEAGGRTLAIERALAYKWVDPVDGERYRDVEVLPPVTVNPAAPTLMFPDAKPRELKVTVRASAGAAAGTLALEPPPGFAAAPASQPFKLEKGGAVELRFRLTPPAGAKTASGVLRAVAEVDGRRCDRAVQRIEHAHIPIQTLLPPAEVKLVRFALTHRRTRIGYLPGAGDEVAAALRQVGYDVTVLNDAALADEPLARFQAIVAGVRAFNVDPRLAALHDRLMKYVADGGTLVVQYNTNNRLSKAPPAIGPLPFTISQERVTDENAAVDAAKHPILMQPHQITADDFAGWVQERGLYFAGEWDPKYDAPLALHDPGEPPRRGALLVARHGKGAFVYTGLAFFRQLPAGVPGAFRLFANLIDYGSH